MSHAPAARGKDTNTATAHLFRSIRGPIRFTQEQYPIAGTCIRPGSAALYFTKTLKNVPYSGLREWRHAPRARRGLAGSGVNVFLLRRNASNPGHSVHGPQKKLLHVTLRKKGRPRLEEGPELFKSFATVACVGPLGARPHWWLRRRRGWDRRGGRSRRSNGLYAITDIDYRLVKKASCLNRANRRCKADSHDCSKPGGDSETDPRDMLKVAVAGLPRPLRSLIIPVHLATAEGQSPFCRGRQCPDRALTKRGKTSRFPS
jgi:hypothetical protein